VSSPLMVYDKRYCAQITIVAIKF